MVFVVLRILKEKRPAAFFLENVAGLCNHDGGRTIETIVGCLKEIDYVPIFKVINAKDVGYPQNRARWYCVGFDKNRFSDMSEDYDFPFPQNKELKYTIDSLIDTQVPSEYDITETCRDNIATHLPEFMHTARYNENHVLIANEVRKSRCNFRCDGISPCLTAKMGTGGNNVPVVVDKGRKLTERECLRIMGYPDSYKIRENFHQSYKQIGNSVVVPIVKEISEELVKILNEQL